MKKLIMALMIACIPVMAWGERTSECYMNLTTKKEECRLKPSGLSLADLIKLCSQPELETICAGYVLGVSDSFKLEYLQRTGDPRNHCMMLPPGKYGFVLEKDTLFSEEGITLITQALQILADDVESKPGSKHSSSTVMAADVTLLALAVAFPCEADYTPPALLHDPMPFLENMDNYIKQQGRFE